MSAFLFLICQGKTDATECSRFPKDEDLTPRALNIVQQVRLNVNSTHNIFCGVQKAAQQTAAPFCTTPNIDAALSDLNYGEWAGKQLHWVMKHESRDFLAWLKGAPPPQGESISDLVRRCDLWLDKHLSLRGNIYAFTSSAVIRGMMMSVIGTDESAFSKIDVKPFSSTILSSNNKRWQLCQAVYNSQCNIT